MACCRAAGFYGLFANAHRGKMRKAGGDPSHPPVIAEETPFIPARGWAELIRKVYEIDRSFVRNAVDR